MAHFATYWRPAGSSAPQYHLVFHNGLKWQTHQVLQRKTPFTLSGVGTQRIPISRPQIVIDTRETKQVAYLIFRDIERHNRPSVAICNDLEKGVWQVIDLSTAPLGQWEPSYDTEMWRRHHVLHLFHQNVGQGDGEALDDLATQDVSVLEWEPARLVD